MTANRPFQPSRFAAQFMLNVGFVEASALRVVGHNWPLLLLGVAVDVRAPGHLCLKLE